MDEDLEELLEELEKSDEEGVNVYVKKPRSEIVEENKKEAGKTNKSSDKGDPPKPEKKKKRKSKKKKTPKPRKIDPEIFNSSDSDDGAARSLIHQKKKREKKVNNNPKRKRRNNTDLLSNKTDKVWLELRSGQSLLNRTEKVVIPTEPAPPILIDLEKFKKKKPSILTPKDLESSYHQTKEDSEELELELTSGEERLDDQISIGLNVSTLQEPVLDTLDLQTLQTPSLNPKGENLIHLSSPGRPGIELKLVLNEQTQNENVPKTLDDELFEEFGVTEESFTKLLDDYNSMSEEEAETTKENLSSQSLKRKLSFEVQPMSKRRRTTRLLSSLKETTNEIISHESYESEESSSSSSEISEKATEHALKSQSRFSFVQSESQDFVNTVMDQDTYSIGISKRGKTTTESNESKDANYFNHEQIISNLLELQDKENKKIQKTKSTSVFFIKKSK